MVPKIRVGFILVESVVSLSISLLIAMSLTLIISNQNRQLNNLEAMTTSHKMILERLKDDRSPTELTFDGEKFVLKESKHQMVVNNSRGKNYGISGY